MKSVSAISLTEWHAIVAGEQGHGTTGSVPKMLSEVERVRPHRPQLRLLSHNQIVLQRARLSSH